MIFDNVSLLNYSYNNLSINDSLTYGVEKNISINGHLLDLKNSNGVSGIFSGIYDLQKKTKTPESIFINGINFGSGYVTKIDVDADKWVRTAKYVADITIISSGNLYNMTGSFFTGDMSYIKNNLYKIGQSFSEEFDFSASENISNYSHDVSFKFDSPIDYNSAVALSKQFANQILGKEVLFALTSGKSNYLNGKKIYEEKYDIINKSFSFSENFTKSFSGTNADIAYTYNININTDGITQISEKADIIGLVDNRLDNTITSFNSNINQSYNRCQSIYSKYCTGFLVTKPFSSGIVYNRFRPSFGFEIVFTNDPNELDGYSWQALVEPTYSSVEEIVLNASINIEGDGKVGTSEKYQNAVLGFNEKNQTIGSKITGAYADFYQNRINSIDHLFNNDTLKLKNRQISSSKFQGTINYDLVFTTKDITGFVSETTMRDVPKYSDYFINNSVVRQKHEQNEIKTRTISTTKKFDRNFGIYDWGNIVTSQCDTCTVNRIQIDTLNNTVTESKTIYDEVFVALT